MVCQKSSNYRDTFSRCFCWTVCTLSSFLTFASIRSSKLWVKMMAAYIQYSKYVPVSFKHDKEVQRKGIKFLRDGGVRIRQNQVQPWEEGRWERDLIKIAEISRSERDMFLDEVNFQFCPGDWLKFWLGVDCRSRRERALCRDVQIARRLLRTWW